MNKRLAENKFKSTRRKTNEMSKCQIPKTELQGVVAWFSCAVIPIMQMNITDFFHLCFRICFDIHSTTNLKIYYHLHNTGSSQHPQRITTQKLKAFWGLMSCSLATA
jgi:hypothetical protein